MRSFDDLYNDIWRPQSIAFSHIIYGIEPVAEMTNVQRASYVSECARLRGEISRENRHLLDLQRKSGIFVEQTLSNPNEKKGK